jgi:Family of unknown function (DUF6326)
MTIISKKIFVTVDRKILLSSLWIFAMFNFAYADIMTIFHTGAEQLDPGLLFGAAILMETAIAMTLLSRVLTYRVNRWANIIIGALNTLAVILSLFVGWPPALFYAFFAIIEIACTLFIIWLAWTWINPEGKPYEKSTD